LNYKEKKTKLRKHKTSKNTTNAAERNSPHVKSTLNALAIPRNEMNKRRNYDDDKRQRQRRKTTTAGEKFNHTQTMAISVLIPLHILQLLFI
jgi:hypothetical protein